MKKDYELLEVDCIGSEFGVDFGVNTYDEDFLVAIANMPPSKSLEEIFVQTDICGWEIKI